MSDFPYPVRFHLPVLSIYSPEFGTGAICNQPGAGSAINGYASLTWPNANEAIYVPFTLTALYEVQSVFWFNGTTAAGNIDIGIFSGTTLMMNLGSTAQSGTSTVQTSAFGPLLLSPGSYYLGFTANSGSSTFGSSVIGGTAPAGLGTQLLRSVGCQQQTSAFPLANATFAAVADFGGTDGPPIIGISSRISTLI